jgi:hypothetical protein
MILLRLSELLCTIGRALIRAGDAFYNFSTGKKPQTYHAWNGEWSEGFYAALGRETWKGRKR